MATWKKVVVSGSNAQLASVTASLSLSVGTNQVITTAAATTFLSGSFSGSFFGNGANLTNVPVSFGSITGLPTIISSSVLSSPLQGQALLTNNGVAGSTIDLGLEAGDTPTFAGVAANGTSFALAASATTVTIAGSSASPTINLGNGTTSNVIIPGNLTVNGTTTVVNTTNVEVKDAFILLASGSVTAGQDGGIIVQSPNTNGTGSAFYWEGTDSRWAVAQTIPASSTSITVNSYVVTVSGSTVDPSGNPTYGGATNGIGNMYVRTDTGDIYIWA